MCIFNLQQNLFLTYFKPIRKALARQIIASEQLDISFELDK